ncbi:hypothetical protein NOR_02983 [Metarhizium rileyi]|uniref:Uncharacterized protein n=1 Tax=Metarhizium rileyi (strain RCEF 4871) TaxID=1649241 RepID=A0A162LX15_METRR|nr:hypothetical protein NOR_02983 [Metarhizium rileyi RCEF 4871]
MLSHLRFHRRGNSNPTSPVPEQSPSFPLVSNCESSQVLDFASPLDGIPASASSSFAPTLPPITRVTSVDSDLQPERNERNERQNGSGIIPESLAPQSQRSSYNGDIGFIGGVALRNYRRDVKAQQMACRAESSERTGSGSSLVHSEDISGRQRLNYLEPNPDVARNSQSKQAASFTTPTDSKISHASNLGRRPAGARLPQDAPILLSNTSSFLVAEPQQKGKKSLPFLKNPMSTLLMRRRNHQNAPDLRPLPLNKKAEGPPYDPRIRGTRVHDFSAPRKPRGVYNGNPEPSRSVSDIHLTPSPEKQPAALNVSGEPSIQARKSAPQSVNTTSTSRYSAHDVDLSREQSESKKNLTNKSTISSSDDASVTTSQQSCTDDNPKLPQSISKGSVIEGVETSPKASLSIHTTRSRNISLSDVSMSAIPRHMKSTSSRFSFDMVGAAEQEKILEDRHRQRELERNTSVNDCSRDSRFDDFDEDAFDYDAMMDDDGLEEKIPGVNADLNEEEVAEAYDLDVELDPDNDQENFAGFEFQRSNPTSALASPYSNGMMITPRDVDGNVIGFAMTKDTPGASVIPSSPSLPTSNEDVTSEQRVSGLGIEEGSANNTALAREDDLYFDDGMIGFENEFSEDLAASPDATDPPFDESIFDNNDTDHFGRPVPGAFQQAQSLRRAHQQSPMKRESDITSRLSAHSVDSRSTAHTSLSANQQEDKETDEGGLKSSVTGSENRIPHIANNDAKSVAAYQAALAAAAHRAAASGKFQRSASPSSLPISGDDESLSEVPQNYMYGSCDDASGGFDFDDDAIIAEANASALANDSDGWYGQEFGFYSAPLGLHPSPQGGGLSGLKDYEYANGGFFGPEGMAALDRSISGRMISREPNLTPITERSEYSNRNSMMSLGYAPLSTSTPIVQSPGLVQLAMMADCGGDQMTLSALLRLRSKAWGGSQASLASSREGSPRSDRGDRSSPPWLSTSIGQASQSRIHSAYSTVNYDSDAASVSGSPTMTMANIKSDQWAQAAIPEEDATEVRHGEHPSSKAAQGGSRALPFDGFISHDLKEASNRRGSFTDVNIQADEHMRGDSARSPIKSHRHKGSADSVSYMKKEDCGETHWVIERRRTGETGDVELLEREFVAGRQI